MQTLNDWKHGDRVYFLDSPEITGTVGAVDPDGVVDVWIDGIRNFRISAFRDKLEWYTRPAPEVLGTHLTLSWNAPAFHYGYLQFFKYPERIVIDRILKDGKADPDGHLAFGNVEYKACPDCSGEVCSTCGTSASDPVRQGNPMPYWAEEVSADLYCRFGPFKPRDFYSFGPREAITPDRIAVGDVVTHADWDGQTETVSSIFVAENHGEIATFESGGYWRTSSLIKVAGMAL